MVVVLVCDTFDTQNNARAATPARCARTLVENGHTVRIITQARAMKNGFDEQSGLSLHILAKPNEKSLREALQDAQAVHIFEICALGKLASKVAGQLGVPAIATFQNVIKAPVYLMLYLAFYRHFDHIHCPSNLVAAQLRKHGYRAQLHVLPPALDPVYSPLEETKKSDGLLHILGDEKDKAFLAEALERSRHTKSIRLHLVGSNPIQDCYQKPSSHLEHQSELEAQKLGLLHCSDLYVEADEVESEASSCLEAIACGLVPLICTSKKNAALQFALTDEQKFKAGDAKALAERIDWCIEHPKELEQLRMEYTFVVNRFRSENPAKSLEHLYSTLAAVQEDYYQHSRLFRAFSRFLYTVIAFPVLIVTTKVFLGLRIEGREHVKGLDGALTVCNHVHLLDCVLIGLAMYPRNVIYPTISKNINSFFPGKIVRALGGVELPGQYSKLNRFFTEMTFQLANHRVIHFFPEGELVPYDTTLRQFKKGAFHLAFEAHVPIVPMRITFTPSKGLRKVIRRKPLLTLHIGKPVYPMSPDPKQDTELRMTAVRAQMDGFVCSSALK